MTKRPRNPSFTLPGYTIPQWANDANYPLVPPPLNPPYVTAETIANWAQYAGIPTKVAHPGAPSTGITPLSAINAQVLNRIWHDAFATDAAAKAYQTLVTNELNDFGARLLDYVGQAPVLAHLHLISGLSNVQLVRYSPGTRTWYAASRTVNDKFQRTQDYGAWPGTTELSGGLLMGASIADFQPNDLGHIVAWANSADIYLEYNGTSWTRYVSTRGKTPSGIPHCVSVNYSPTSGTWSVVFNPTIAASPQVFYGTDRVFWTNTTLPFPNGTEVRVGSDGANGLAAMGRKGTNIYFSYSADGGATWSAAQTIDTGITADFVLPLVTPVWTGFDWVTVATGDGATPQTKTYVSSDGVGWSQTGFMSASQIQALAATGDCWFASLTSGQFVVSVDRGQTWRFLDRAFGAFSLQHIYLAGSRFVISGSGNAILVPGGGVGIGGAQGT